MANRVQSVSIYYTYRIILGILALLFLIFWGFFSDDYGYNLSGELFLLLVLLLGIFILINRRLSKGRSDGVNSILVGIILFFVVVYILIYSVMLFLL